MLTEHLASIHRLGLGVGRGGANGVGLVVWGLRVGQRVRRGLWWTWRGGCGAIAGCQRWGWCAVRLAAMAVFGRSLVAGRVVRQALW